MDQREVPELFLPWVDISYDIVNKHTSWIGISYDNIFEKDRFKLMTILDSAWSYSQVYDYVNMYIGYGLNIWV